MKRIQRTLVKSIKMFLAVFVTFSCLGFTNLKATNERFTTTSAENGNAIELQYHVADDSLTETSISLSTDEHATVLYLGSKAADDLFPCGSGELTFKMIADNGYVFTQANSSVNRLTPNGQLSDFVNVEFNEQKTEAMITVKHSTGYAGEEQQITNGATHYHGTSQDALLDIQISMGVIENMTQTNTVSYTVDHVVDGVVQATTTTSEEVWVNAPQQLAVTAESITPNTYEGYTFNATSLQIASGTMVENGTVIQLNYTKDKVEAETNNKQENLVKVEYYENKKDTSPITVEQANPVTLKDSDFVHDNAKSFVGWTDQPDLVKSQEMVVNAKTLASLQSQNVLYNAGDVYTVKNGIAKLYAVYAKDKVEEKEPNITTTVYLHDEFIADKEEAEGVPSDGSKQWTHLENQDQLNHDSALVYDEAEIKAMFAAYVADHYDAAYADYSGFVAQYTLKDENGNQTWIEHSNDPDLVLPDGTEIRYHIYLSAKYDVTTSINGNGTISESAIVKSSNSTTVQYSADEGYKIVSVSDNGTPVKDMNGSYEIKNIKANHTIEVTTEKLPEIRTTVWLSDKFKGNLGENEWTDLKQNQTNYHSNLVYTDADIQKMYNEYVTGKYDDDHAFLDSYEVLYALKDQQGWETYQPGLELPDGAEIRYHIYLNAKYDVTTSINGNGTISESAIVVSEGNATVQYSADKGYKIVSVSDNGTPVKDMNGSYEAKNIKKNHKIEVTTAKDDTQTEEISYQVEHWVDGVLAPADTIKVTNNIWINDAHELSVTNESVKQNTYKGYAFIGYTVDGNIIDINTLKTIPSGKTIKVEYVKDEKQTEEISYQVEHWIDGVLAPTDTIKVTDNIWVNDAHELSVTAESIATNNYVGYKFDGNLSITAGNVVADGTTIVLNYVKDDAQTVAVHYNVEHMVEGETIARDTTMITDTVWVNADKELSVTTESIATNNYVGYKFDGNLSITAGNVVADGTTIVLNYVKDDAQTVAVHYNVEHMVEGETIARDTTMITDTVWVNADKELSVTTESIATNNYVGYKFDGNLSITAGDVVADGTTIVLNYVKDDAQTVAVYYNVEHMVEGETIARDTTMITDTVWVNADKELSVTAASIATNNYVGYKFDGNLSITAGDVVADGTVIVLNYVKDDAQVKTLSYTVNHFINGTLTESDIVRNTVWINDQVNFITVEPIQYRTFEGYVLDHSDPEVLPSVMQNGGIINVYYVTTPEPVVPIGPTTPDTPTTPTLPTTPGTPTTPTLPTTPEAPAAPVAATPTLPITIGLNVPTTLLPTITPEEEVVVEEAETPLANGEEQVLERQETPLAKPSDGGWAVVNLVSTGVTVLLSGLLLISKRHKDEDDDEEENKETVNAKDEEEKTTKKRGWISRVASVGISAVSILAFLISEDMSLPMILVDHWTLAMLMMAVGQVGVFFVSRKWKKEEQEEQQPEATNEQ